MDFSVPGRRCRQVDLGRFFWRDLFVQLIEEHRMGFAIVDGDPGYNRLGPNRQRPPVWSRMLAAMNLLVERHHNGHG